MEPPITNMTNLESASQRHSATSSAFHWPQLLDDRKDIGVSLALSPEDILPEMTLETSANGHFAFSRLFCRISEKHPVRFAMDIVAHEGDWRGGMRWMTMRYPDFFEPPLASAQRLGGTAAYSSYEGPLDAATFKRMAFTVNWKASFDFPYQGMFIPPVADQEEWPRGYQTSESPPINFRPYDIDSGTGGLLPQDARNGI